MKSRSSQNLLLYIIVFCCGALVMIYELIGSRIVAPFIGASTYIWTALIGVILAALSLGYWIGGKAADKRPAAEALGGVLFAAAACVSLTMLVKEVVLAFIAETDLPLEIKALSAALILFAPASVVLGFVTPYAVKLTLSGIDNAGSAVGRIYACSTVGSIVGTFAAGFFLIPFVGSQRTLYLIAGVLFILSIILTAAAFTTFRISALVLFVFGVAGTEATMVFNARGDVLADIDTEYNRIRVLDTIDPTTKRPIVAITTDPISTQSARFKTDDELVFAYNRYYHLVNLFKPDFKHTLMIGGAGYTFPQSYLKTYPDATLDVAEIDPQMTGIAREYFGLTHDPRLRIFHDDGRVFLNSAKDAEYDAVFMDAFGSVLTTPFQLTTIEAVKQIDRVLKPDGVVIFNIAASLVGPKSRVLRSELATYRQIFPQVLIFKVKTENPDEKIQNMIIAALKRPVPIDTDSINGKITQLSRNQVTLNDPEATPFTDDRPATELRGF